MNWNATDGIRGVITGLLRKAEKVELRKAEETEKPRRISAEYPLDIRWISSQSDGL